MSDYESVKQKHKHAQNKLQHFTRQITHRYLLNAKRIAESEQPNVKQPEKIEKRRNQREPQTVPFRNEQLENQQRQPGQPRSHYRKFLNVFLLDDVYLHRYCTLSLCPAYNSAQTDI